MGNVRSLSVCHVEHLSNEKESYENMSATLKLTEYTTFHFANV